jgi:hypothetical protein
MVWVELSGPDVVSSTLSYLGDVQPGEQKSFSVEGKLRGESGQVFLVFTYRDRFGDVQVHSVAINVKIEGQVTRLETARTTTPTGIAQSSFSTSSIIGIAVWIASFVALFAVTYLVLRRRAGRRGRGGENADQA